MTKGTRVGAHFLLSPARDNRIGRDLECDMVLSDPLCSRVHAVVQCRDDRWWLVDQGSRNGSYLADTKVSEGELSPGALLRFGSVEFEFCQQEMQPTELTQVEVTERIVLDSEVPGSGAPLPEGLRADRRSRDLLALHELSLRLLAAPDADAVAQQCLEEIKQRTASSVVGFLWLTDDGQLKAKLTVPDSASHVKLSEMLTEMVCRRRRAVWVDSQSAPDEKGELKHYADAICVPLLRDPQRDPGAPGAPDVPSAPGVALDAGGAAAANASGTPGADGRAAAGGTAAVKSDDVVLGALHLYSETARFTQEHFDYAVAVARTMVVALVRARRQDALRVDHQRLVSKSGASGELLGRSAVMETLQGRIERIARATGCVLIRGESGAGKELVARAVHRASPRSDRPMLSVNCAAIPPDLMESQLFGHQRGAFTGADSDHAGWFRQAHSGTLFLDEVGELTLEGQAKLLRILEGHPFLPVGATKEVTVDVRVIAATNRDLREFVREKRFREDLYYRLSVFELHVPPLRERGEDVRLLIEHFLEHFRRQHGRTHLALSPEALQRLLEYQWPGNVRQLRNVIDSAVVLADDEILPDDLGLRDAVGTALESLKISDCERRLIAKALSRTGDNVVEAAKLLGIGRATLYRKIEEYGISR